MWVYPEIRFLADLVTYHARRTPNKLAMTYGEQRYDYAALEVESARVANALLAEGVKTQDRVVFFGKNSADFFLAMFGSARSGACFIPLNWRLAAPELAQVSADAAPVFAIVEREFEAVWQEVCKEAGITTGYVVIDDAQRLSAWSGGYAAVLPKLNLREDDAVIQLYTSGTTGVPKGVLHTHASFNHSRLSEHFERAYHWQDGEVFLYALPNFHLLGVASVSYTHLFWS